MKIKGILLIICFIGLCSIVSAQEYAIDKKATIITGSGSILSQGGDLFENSGNKITTLNLSPTINYFITRNLFIGAGIEYSSSSQGDISSKSLGIGPQIGYAFGGPKSTVFPFIDLGISYYKMDSDYGFGKSSTAGSDISFGFGVIIPVKNHIGLIFEGGYHIMDLKLNSSSSSISGNILSLGIGISGLLFHDIK